MRRLFILLLPSLFAQSISLAQFGWIQQTSGTTENLTSVFFVNSNMGWVVGDEGTIIHTSDGGETWLEQQTGIDSCIWNSVYFIDSDNGYTAGGQVSGGSIALGVILKTTNGGTDWTTSFLGGLNSPSFNSIYFIDESIGWAVGYNGLIMNTTDSGATWILESTIPPIDFYSVFFVDGNTGWAVGDKIFWNNWMNICKTTNGGSSWLSQITESSYLFDVHFISDEIGWVAGTYVGSFFNVTEIYKTIDGGDNWVYQSNASFYGNILAIFFIDENFGWAVWNDAYDGYIIGTTNSGKLWTEQSICPGISLWDVFFIDTNTGWAVGDSGKIYHTTTGGVSFVEETNLNEIPLQNELSNNFPDPFNPSTKIRYSIPQLSNVVIKVFDILGNEIETLVDEQKLAGTYELTWNATNLPSGVYLYQLQSGEFIETKKMVLMK
jgi:photosystem II stability/assembly factor-like uncharacterized protein